MHLLRTPARLPRMNLPAITRCCSLPFCCAASALSGSTASAKSFSSKYRRRVAGTAPHRTAPLRLVAVARRSLSRRTVQCNANSCYAADPSLTAPIRARVGGRAAGRPREGGGPPRLADDEQAHDCSWLHLGAKRRRSDDGAAGTDSRCRLTLFSPPAPSWAVGIRSCYRGTCCAFSAAAASRLCA